MSENNNTQAGKLILVDAFALIFRAYYAFIKNPRYNSKGLNTSAIFGFANTLFDIINKENPTHIGIAFDSPGATERTIEYPEYKANREEAPEDISLSIPYIFALAEALNIPVLIAEGYEADDIVGTIAKKAEQHNFLTYMVTSDKDFGQLVSDKTFIYKPGRGGSEYEIVGPKEVCEKFSLKNPEQFIDILGLSGDASDNIPGVPGVGEKTAIKLIAEFDSIENLLKNTAKLKGKLKENLEQFAEQALMSKRLATIMTDVPVEFKPQELIITKPNITKLKALFEELEFKRLATKLLPPEELDIVETTKTTNLFDIPDLIPETQNEKEKNNIHTVTHQYYCVSSKEERKSLINKLLKAKTVCFDTETTGIDPHNSELVGLSFSFEKHSAYYIPLPENYQLALETVHEFKAFFENEKIDKVGQNLKFDIAILKWYEIEVKGRLCDTMLAHYLLQPDLRNNHNMDFMAESRLNYTPVSISSLIGKKGPTQTSMRDVPLEDITEYACEDADITLQLWQVFEPELVEAGLIPLFDKVECPLIHVLADMEANGVNLDTKALRAFSSELTGELQAIQNKVIAYAGQEFNLSSPKQLGEILFEKLKISAKPKLTKTKQYATGEEVLEQLYDRHPIIPLILEFRTLNKLLTTYVDVLPEMLNPRTKRLHTSFNQAVTTTGRLSSNNPNLQNIPIRTEKGKEIRRAFIPRNNKYKLIAADYSQIELRIMAHLSGDSAMIADFKKGLDIHTETASRIYGLDSGSVDSDMRRKAKMVNFGIIYGISAFGLSQRLRIPRREAEEIISRYFSQYQGVKRYMDEQIALAREHGFVETLLKRRRYLKDINSVNGNIRAAAEREAINASVQGSAADMIKVAMIRVYDSFQKLGLKSKMVLQIHDELVFDCPKTEIEKASAIIRETMINAIPLSIPVEVDVRNADNWLDAH